MRRLMTRPVLRPFYLFAAIATCTLLSAVSPVAARETTATDILLITGDDMGPYLGCYGDPHAKTPNMDKVAAQGVRFDNAWVTQASCSPSRSSIMTGLYPHQNGMIGLAHRGFSMSGDFPSVPSLLKTAGYYTGVVGKIHLKPMSSFPFDYTAEFNGFGRQDVRAYTERVTTFLQQAGDKPIFLNVSYADPHRDFNDQVKGLPEHPVKAEDVSLLPFMKGLDHIKGLLQEVAGYYNGIMRVDAGLGMVLAELKKAGRLDNTLIIVIGDHGAPFGRAKVTCFNQGMRIPFIVKWPGVSKSGTATDSLVSTIDLLPTFLDAAGVDKPENLPGTSVRAAVADTSADLHKYIFGEFTAHLPADYFPQRTVRNKQYQLIENLVSPEPNPTPGIEGKSEREALANNVEMTTSAQAALQTYVNPPRFQLYDLQADPNNFNNLAGNPQYAKVQQELKSALDAWRKESNDPLLKPGEIERLRQEVREIKKLDDTKSRKPARRAPGARGGRKQSGDALATSPE